jgi:3-oxoacyl-[acyl-carrier protein] reductase
VDGTTRDLGKLTILVNNAGVTDRAPFLSMTLDFWERVLRINLTGAMLCSQEAARAMQQAGGGRIINVASISGQRGGSERAAYGASKAGLINLTAVMALELAPHNITVNAIAPGPTDVGRAVLGDPAQARASLSRMAIKRSALPSEIAVAAVFLAERENTMVTGHVLNVDGGFNATGIVYDS